MKHLIEIILRHFKEIIIALYILILFVVGVFFVPVYVVWGGNEVYIEELVFTPLWNLMNYNSYINGFIPRYELCLERAIYQVLIITLIMFFIYLLFNLVNKNMHEAEKSENHNK